MIESIKNNSLISIVVPVFNTEDYLQKCLDSISNQSYDNIEIIIVDDGSTDNSPSICDAFAKKDKRIKVIHKKNGGVSSARNLGIELASGEYVTFIDADDFIEKDMIEILYKAIIKSKSDISTCATINQKEGQDIALDNNTNSTNTITNYKALENMLYQKDIVNAPYAKLYKKELFDDECFDEKISIAEDLDINYRLFLKAKRIAVNSSKKYHYIQRPGSAMKSSFNKKRMDGLIVAKRILADTRLNHKSLIKPSIDRLFMESIYIAIDIPCNSANYTMHYKECVDLIKKYNKNVLFNNQSRKRFRLYALISIVNANLLIMLLKFKKTIINSKELLK